MDQTKFDKLQRSVKALESEEAQAKGALTQLLEQLEEVYGCENLKDVQQKLKEIEEQEGKLTREYEQALREFEEAYDENLGGD